MQLFILDQKSPSNCAKQMCDRHLIKQILECAQLISTTASKYVSNFTPFYKPTHVNHPITKWIQKSYANFMYTLCYFLQCCKEYTYRFGKLHKCHKIVCESISKTLLLKSNIFTDKEYAKAVDYCVCVSEWYNEKLSVQDNYRNYYNHKLNEWQQRDRPLKVIYTNRKEPKWLQLEPTEELL